MSQVNRAVLVTGSTGGVGRAVVEHLTSTGWRVFAGARSLDAATASYGTNASVTPVRLDVADEASVAAAHDEIAGLLAGRRLDGLVNLAGLSVDGPLELVPTAELRRQFEVNVIGVMAVTQSLLPLLRPVRPGAPGGRVVNMGGAAGRMTLPMYGPLSASKAALDSLSNALRMELRDQGVTVSYVEPSGLDTGFFATSAAARQAWPTRGAADEIYRRATETATANMASARPAPVREAVRAIGRALTDRRPARRYLVGRDTRLMMPMLRALPAALRERLVLRNLGLTRDVFPLTADAKP
jgi:NAD(P)-dependent dehydrogenase (short-subunit alcohol dehydrogenase family)